MLRDVMRLAWSKMHHDWARTSTVLWMLYSVNRGEKSPEKSPRDFNPLLADGE